jgi:hypothetical protein
MNKFFDVIPKISNSWNLAAFCIAGLIWFVVKMKKGKVPAIAWGVIAAIVIVVLMTSYVNSDGIYRVRIVVLDEHQMPTNDAQVTCSVGGEVKKVDGGWECDIPSKTKPSDGKLQAYASVQGAYLTGHEEIELKDDYNPVLKIHLGKDTSAQVRGIVVDENNNPVTDAYIGVVGYADEAATTKTGGNFAIPAHKADGQQVQIFAFKKGYMSIAGEWHQAGDYPVTIVLRQQHLF